MPRRYRIPTPSQEELNRIFDYNPDTGSLSWKPREDRSSGWNEIYAGKAAGCVDVHSYVAVKIGDIPMKAHRLIWKMVNGEDADHIDHINGDRSDNRISNLRDVSALENQRNRKLNGNNSTGHTGVVWNARRQKYVASICVKGTHTYLGGFTKIEDAISARQAANITFNFSENHGAKR